MIITTGRIIKVEVGDYLLECTSEAPGAVRVRNKRSQEGVLVLPGNPTDASHFVAAYLRVVATDIGYRERNVEFTSVGELVEALEKFEKAKARGAT